MGIARLKNQSVYVAGPLDSLVDINDGIKWRNNLKPFFDSINVKVNDPCDKPCQRADEINHPREVRQQYYQNKEWDKLSKLYKEIIKVDLRLVDQSTILVALLDMSPEIKLTGTIHEIVLSSQQRKNIFIVCPQGLQKIPPWWYGLLDYRLFFDNFEDMKKVLLDIDSGIETRFDDKFVFFDKI